MLGKLIKAGTGFGLFAGGAAAATLGKKVLTSKKTKTMAASVVAKGYHVVDEVNSMVSQVKQEAEDVFEEAKDIYEADKKEADLADLDELAAAEVVE